MACAGQFGSGTAAMAALALAFFHIEKQGLMMKDSIFPEATWFSMPFGIWKAASVSQRDGGWQFRRSSYYIDRNFGRDDHSAGCPQAAARRRSSRPEPGGSS